jgi:excisionase family DNA binding protein
MNAPCEPVKSATTLPEFLTARDLAELLKVSEKSIARWASQDASMPAIRLGRMVRFERQAVLDWLRSRTQGRRKRAAA